MTLTDIRIRNAKPNEKAYKLSDSGGLYLLVTPAGARYWRMDYRLAGKRRTLALGVYPLVTLSDARARRQDARVLLAKDIDPSSSKRAAKRTSKLGNDNNFRAVAREWLEKQRIRLAPRYRALILARLEADIFPQIGSRPVSDIDALELLEVIRNVEKRGVLETARRIRQICGQNRRGEAHNLLSQVYDRFTEGFDTPDLKDARALLDDLKTAGIPPP